MVEFALPKNSRITVGKTWPKPAGATETREFKVYRWNPDDGKNPSVDTYFVDTHDCSPMVLDGLIWIKNNIGQCGRPKDGRLTDAVSPR